MNSALLKVSPWRTMARPEYFILKNYGVVVGSASVIIPVRMYGCTIGDHGLSGDD